MKAGGIVDTHIHFIDPGRFTYPWLARRPDVDRRFLEGDYLRLSVGADVERIVLIEAAVRDADAIGEAEWMSDLAARSELVGAIVTGAARARSRGPRRARPASATAESHRHTPCRARPVPERPRLLRKA